MPFNRIEWDSFLLLILLLIYYYESLPQCFLFTVDLLWVTYIGNEREREPQRLTTTKNAFLFHICMWCCGRKIYLCTHICFNNTPVPVHSLPRYVCKRVSERKREKDVWANNCLGNDTIFFSYFIFVASSSGVYKEIKIYCSLRDLEIVFRKNKYYDFMLFN